MLQNPEFWVAAAFVIFLLLIWRPAGKAHTGGLDERSRRIAADLQEAARLRTEAEAMLATAREQHGKALKDAAAITKQAAEDAELLKREAETALEELVQRREAQAVERIAQAEGRAMTALRAQAASIALAATRAILTERLAGEEGDHLISAATAELPQLLS
jgi:F-type H+-transporting ATPase subunit b